ncbi:short chain dehydrogenase [Seminavis robusta]|uniref:Short chain dehydrogenase n=1 Tax=Seminavis robusta TaxID=568900 RepID=A0A9N8DT23_9STRA|nr:short chain dehydrogenase [Seminavis robusta]|eukprot:Sro330_g118930.1 short chain dehydrogenase (492) ;mRNA; f:35039-36514
MTAGNNDTVASKAHCDRQYYLTKNTQLYWTLQNTWTYPYAQTYVNRLLQEAPAVKGPLNKQLAVITNIALNGSSYHAAEELALSLGMHLILLSGKKLSKLKQVEEALLREARQRGVANNTNYLKPTVYKIQYDDNSLSSVMQAAQDVMEIANNGSKDGKFQYNGQIPVLIHNPSGVTVAYETTKEGIEINVARNFVAPHLLTEQLLPCLKKAATDTFKPRIVQVSSVGHCQGTDFDPERFLDMPEEGGAPDGTLQQTLVNEDGDNTHVAVKVYVENEELDGPVVMYYRSRMAVIADGIALAREEPSLAPVSVYPGSVSSSSKKSLGIAETIYQTGFSVFQLSPRQAARATLRAVLDPIFNDGSVSHMRGAYLHCDGNAWTVADPTVEDPVTGAPYILDDYATKVRECVKRLLSERIQPTADGPETTHGDATKSQEDKGESDEKAGTEKTSDETSEEPPKDLLSGDDDDTKPALEESQVVPSENDSEKQGEE